ncbi:phage virion morphogenesis protein [Pseudanabaena sp. PCC 6802]|uniref:phage virion morphogenesis protein n=1 Tax=Pseudanabaena sp. PCC 6802 TaxID=118173 RepID=UPI0003478BB4|nr:phage virion morphogenesis protein [Pseudanabaena sp. PCC 6802]
MAFLEITVDDREINEALQRLAEKTSDLSPAMRNIGEYMRMRAEENFANESSPDGSAWRALSPKYAAQKQKRRGIDKILQFKGDLRASIAYQLQGKDGVAIGTNVAIGAYSLGAIHQLGAPRRNIPARPFLGVSDADVEEIVAIIEDFIGE